MLASGEPSETDLVNWGGASREDARASLLECRRIYCGLRRRRRARRPVDLGASEPGEAVAPEPAEVAALSLARRL